MQYLGTISKMIEWSLFPRQTIQQHSNPSLCLNHYCWSSWSWMVLWRPTVSSRTNTKKRYLFHHRGLECKCKKSRDTQNNRQGWPWSTKWREKANRFLSGEHTGHRKHPFPTIQEITLLMNITRWWFRLKWKKVGKATRPFRYDLNEIPYDYIVEVTKRFKGLNLVDTEHEELWTEFCNNL